MCRLLFHILLITRKYLVRHKSRKLKFCQNDKKKLLSHGDEQEESKKRAIFILRESYDIFLPEWQSRKGYIKNLSTIYVYSIIIDCYSLNIDKICISIKRLTIVNSIIYKILSEYFHIILKYSF